MPGKLPDLHHETAERQEAAVYKTYLENSHAAEELMDEILKGTKAGEPLALLLIKAAQAISKMTNNRNFEDQINLYVRGVYGEALGEPGAAAITAQELREHIARLETAHAAAAEPDLANAILLSIKAHKLRLERVEALMEANK